MARYPQHLRKVDKALLEATGLRLPLEAAPIRFASWMGGDRDGNPNVTAAVTREVLLLARWMAADLFLRDIDALAAELSMQQASDALRERVGDSPEPYRAVLKQLRDRLRATRAWAHSALTGSQPASAEVLVDNRDLIAPLESATSRCTRVAWALSPKARCSTACAAPSPSGFSSAAWTCARTLPATVMR